MPSIGISQSMEYLRQKRNRLQEIKAEVIKHPDIDSIFKEKDWFSRVEEQLSMWEKSPESSLKEITITIPEYELFRYFEEDSILDRFIDSFNILENRTQSDRTKYQKWRASKYQLFSQQVSQIYSTLFEVLVLGKLISSRLNVEPYYENIDGRMMIDKRFIYFEIKSLQKSRFDLSGIGVGGTQHDDLQIMTALKEKAGQLNPYIDETNLIILSLYRLADMITGEWYTNDFFMTTEGKIISGVIIYSWFTAGEGKKILINPNANHPLSSSEISSLSVDI